MVSASCVQPRCLSRSRNWPVRSRRFTSSDSPIKISCLKSSHNIAKQRSLWGSASFRSRRDFGQLEGNLILHSETLEPSWDFCLSKGSRDSSRDYLSGTQPETPSCAKPSTPMQLPARVEGAQLSNINQSFRPLSYCADLWRSTAGFCSLSLVEMLSRFSQWWQGSARCRRTRKVA